MNRHFLRVIALCLFTGLFCLAQNKGQPAATAPSQANTPQQQQNIPPELYPLDQLPRTVLDAEASLTMSKWYNLFKLHKKGSPRFIWYKVLTSINRPASAASSAPASTAIPVILIPLACKDAPRLNPQDPNYDPKFDEACGKPGIKHGKEYFAPTLPSQNRNPLKLGDALIIAIYDPDDLLTKFHVSLVGLTVQSQNGTVLNTDPLRPAISASGGSSPTGGAAAAPTSPAGFSAKGIIVPFNQPPRAAGVPPPAACASISLNDGDKQAHEPRTPFPKLLSVKVVAADGKSTTAVPVTFYPLPTNGPTGTLGKSGVPGPQTVYPGDNGIAAVELTAGGQVGKYQVLAWCPGEKGRTLTFLFDEANSSNQYYYLPWLNNPLLGDTILSVAVTVQAPAPVPLTINTNPPDLTFTVDGQPYRATTTLTRPSGSTVQISTTEQQNRRDQNDRSVPYRFFRWSDGSSRADHGSVAIGSSPTLLTAEFARVDVPPNVPITLLSNPPGAGVSVAGVSVAGCSTSAAPPVWMCPAASDITVSAPTNNPFNGQLYQFQRWSDGTPVANCAQYYSCAQVPVGKEPITLIANYAKATITPTPTPLTLASNPPGLLTIVSQVGYILPSVLPFPAGTNLQIDVPPNQRIDRNNHTFIGWAPPINNPFQVPAMPLVATAGFDNANNQNQPIPAGNLTIATQPPGLFVSVVEPTGQTYLQDKARINAQPNVTVIFDASPTSASHPRVVVDLGQFLK